MTRYLFIKCTDDAQSSKRPNYALKQCDTAKLVRQLRWWERAVKYIVNVVNFT